MKKESKRRQTTKTKINAMVVDLDAHDQVIGQPYRVEVHAENGDEAEIYRQAQAATGRLSIDLVGYEIAQQ